MGYGDIQSKLIDFGKSTKFINSFVGELSLRGVLLKSGSDRHFLNETTKPEKKYALNDIVRSRLESMLHSELPVVTIHQGGTGQEILKSIGAVALTKGSDVYLREDVVQEGSVELDAILLHEATHVVQNKEKRIKYKEDIIEAEKEAEQNEEKAYGTNLTRCAEINGQLVFFNKRTQKEAIEYAKYLLKQEINEAVLNEDLCLLLSIQKRLNKL
jgi:hypothetical protein